MPDDTDNMLFTLFEGLRDHAEEIVDDFVDRIETEIRRLDRMGEVAAPPVDRIMLSTMVQALNLLVRLVASGSEPTQQPTTPP